MIDANEVKTWAENIKPAWIGGMGGTLTYLYLRAQDEKPLKAFLWLVYCTTGSAAAYVAGAGMDHFMPDFGGKYVVMFLVSTAGYKLFGIAQEKILAVASAWKPPI